jgi:hypothetical protein
MFDFGANKILLIYLTPPFAVVIVLLRLLLSGG